MQSACSSSGRSVRSTRRHRGRAVAKPIRARGADIASDALQTIVDETRGYPYFLQEWGKHAWDVAERSPIVAGDVARASTEVAASLDAGFFRARFDRLASAQKRYLRAMAVWQTAGTFPAFPSTHRRADMGSIAAARPPDERAQ